MEHHAVFLFVTVVFCVVHRSGCFNFNLKDVEVFSVQSPKGARDNYFGFTVLLQKGDPPVVVVGSPKSNSTVNRQLNQPGALYRCHIGDRLGCHSYPLDGSGYDEQLSDAYFAYVGHKDGMLLGAALDGEEAANGSLVVCAPRWINKVMSSQYSPNGLCYAIDDSSVLGEAGWTLIPLLNAQYRGYIVDNVTSYYYMIGEAGMSVALANKDLLIGAPGVLHWRGTVVRYSSWKTTVNKEPGRYQSAHASVPNPARNAGVLPKAEEHSYIGYSVTSGRFLGGKEDVWSVAGAPRGKGLHGTVLMFRSQNTNEMEVLRVFSGTQFGSYFGASILTAHVTGGPAADLLVGAPTQNLGSWDEGCVFVYQNDGNAVFDEGAVEVHGDMVAGSRFGTAMSSVGYINADKCEDVAIAAPYEDDGRGAVYIYLGSKQHGLVVPYAQRIPAASIDETLRGFGYALSKGVDIDEDGFKDLAIGAYKSGKVAVVRSRPVVRYRAKLEVDLKELSLTTRQFQARYCVKFESAAGALKLVRTRADLVLDKRTQADQTGLNTAGLLTAVPDADTCGTLQVLVKANIADYVNPITVKLDVKPEDETTFVIDPESVAQVQLEVPFANGCGKDNICRPQLSLGLVVPREGFDLVLGATNTIKLTVTVENREEPSYLTQLHVQLPPRVEIVQLLSKCELSDREVRCLVDNVILPGTSRRLTLEFDVRHLHPTQKFLTFNFTATSRGEEVNLDDNSVVAKLPVGLRHDVKILGNSFPDQLSYEEDARFRHEFFVKNLGPSPLAAPELLFQIPIGAGEDVLIDVYRPEVISNGAIRCEAQGGWSLSTDENNDRDTDVDVSQPDAIKGRVRRNGDRGKPQTFSDLPLNKTLFVNCSDAALKCARMVCAGDEGATLPRGQYLTVIIGMKVNIDVLNRIKGVKDIVVVASSVQLLNKDVATGDMYYAKTLLIGSLEKEGIAYWVYAVSIVSALLILTALIYGLHKLRFFNRPLRERLENETEVSPEREQGSTSADAGDDNDESTT